MSKLHMKWLQLNWHTHYIILEMDQYALEC